MRRKYFCVIECNVKIAPNVFYWINILVAARVTFLISELQYLAQGFLGLI